MLILNDLTPLHWALGGGAIGLITLLLWVTNQRLGISTGFENIRAPVVRAPYFQRRELAMASLGGGPKT
jgi:hypothetical protein